MPNTFKKEERLCSKRIITDVFTHGNSLFIHPFKIQFNFTTLPSPVPAQILLTVSKRAYAKANQRNQIKRYMREAYRLQKNTLYNALTQQQKQCAIAIICVKAEKFTYHYTEEKMKLILDRIINIKK